MKTFYIALFLLSTISVTQSQWTNQNPFPGNYLGGVFFIDDNTGWISGGPIQFIDQNIGWRCGGGVIKKTTNAGLDWIPQSGKSGINKTTNGGESWFELTTGTTEILTDLHFCNINIGYAVGYNGIILKTTDSGTNWIIQKADAPYDLYSVDFVDTFIGFAVGGRDSSKFLKTTDGGLNWTEKTTVLNYLEKIINCVEFIDANVGWVGWGEPIGGAGNGRSKLSSTTDGGQTWFTRTIYRPIDEEDTTNNEHETDNLIDTQLGIRSIYFKDANNGYAVSGSASGWKRGILCTTNGGVTWASKYFNDEQTGLLSIFVTNGGKGWAVGYSGVIYMTEDNGFNWSQILSGSIGSWTGDRINAVHMVDDSLGWAAGSRKGTQKFYLIMKTTNGGKIWKTSFQSNSWYTEFTDIFFKDENYGWASNSLYGGGYSTTNGGQNWSNSITFNDIFFINQNVGWGARTPSGIVKTTDGGSTWVQKSTISSFSVYFSDINNGWAVGSGGVILKSTDGGENWISKISGTFLDLQVVRFYDNNIGMCIGSLGEVLVSSDGGESWIIKIGPSLYNLTFINSTTIWGSTADGALFKTTDFGNTWNSLNVGIGGVSSFFTNENTGWVASGGNSIYKYAVEPPNPPLWTNEIILEDAGGTESSQVLTFGQHRDATDSIDLSLGEYELPPPIAGIFDARLNLPTSPIMSSLKDYRDSVKTEITWTMTFQPGPAGYPMTFSWDSTSFPAGTFYLKDLIDGSYVFVNMKNHSRYTLTEPGITSLSISYQGILSSVIVNNEWNMISVPLLAEDMSLSSLFSTATSLAYSFESSYVTEDTLVGGKGYWLKFDGNQQIQIFGSRMGETVPLEIGWNMFGGDEKDIPISQITTTPPGIIATYFFGFNDGYYIADTLKPGQGYWVRVTQNGVINLNSGGLLKVGEQEQFAEIDNGWGQIRITESNGKSITLYAAEEEIESNFYDLPPMPPTGIFDSRYSSGRLVENLSSEKTIMINSDSYPITIKAEGINIKVRDRINGELLNEELKSREELRITNNKITSIEVIGKITGGLPVSYELFQNYPNPFNPSTTIKFSVPKESNIILSIYNVLGELVSTIVNQEIKPGYFEYEFDASSLASGIYIYRITAGDPSTGSGQGFIQTRKMVLLK